MHCHTQVVVGLTFWSSTRTIAAPTVTLKNGTYYGKHVASYNQDLFLGIPYAQPPVGDLRLQNPQSLNSTFGNKTAYDYSASCVGYGNSDSWPFTLSEDCLTINVIRPTGYESNAGLPVGVFIHGGGWTMDYAANAVYNLSFIVEQSVIIAKPIIGVSFDYRLSAWGFLASQEIVDAGVANLGLKDQRLALHFIKENIAAFGGDPEKVVIWGESAGGGNVGYHATAYGGRDEGLFRGIIAESGAEGAQPINLTVPTQRYDNLTRAVGCGDAADKLVCLRQVPFEQLNASIVAATDGTYYPVVDGDLVPDYSSTLLEQEKFVKVPLLAGTNADEGTLFLIGSTFNSDAQIEASIRALGLDHNTTSILMILYPNVDALGLPSTYFPSANATGGSQYKRAIALETDQLFLSWRRLRTDVWSKAGVPTYSYLFDSPLGGAGSSIGTPHFGEIGYVFHNTLNLGYRAAIAPFANATRDVLNLADLTSRMWVSFIHDLDPNGHGVEGVGKWPLYDGAGGHGKNFYLHPGNSGEQDDILRLAGTTFINSVAREQYGR